MTGYIEAFFDSAVTGAIRDIITFAREEVVLAEGPREDQRFNPGWAPFSKIVLQALENKSNLFKQAAIIAPAQSGKTLLCQGVKALYDTCELRIPIGYGGPTDDTVVASWNANMKPIIEKSKFKNLFPTEGAGSKSGVARNMQLKNGVQIYMFGGGGSDAQRSGKTVRNVIITEVDKMDEPGQSSREADPIRQIIARTFSYGEESFSILECTVSNKDGRIWLEYYKRGSGGCVFIRCPHCRNWIYPEREFFVGWQEAKDVREAGKNASYACQKCGVLWNESDRLAAQQEPVLIHRKQEIDSDGKISGLAPEEWTDKLGIRWNWMNVPMEMVSMAQVAAQEWECANEDPDSRDRTNQEKELHQFRWAIPYEESTDTRKLTVNLIHKHGGDHDKTEIPPHSQFQVAAIDIQMRWCYWTVYGYAVTKGGLTAWFIDYGIERFLPDGREHEEPSEGQVKGGLDRSVQTILEYNPLHIGVDINYYTNLVTRWVDERKGKLRPLVGRGTNQFGSMTRGGKTGKKIDVPQACSHFADARLQNSGDIILFLNVDELKSDFQGRFFIPQGENGCIYLFRQIADFGTYARHLTAEHEEVTWVPGKGWQKKWKQLKKRNDLLDCSTYCEGLAQLEGAQMRLKIKQHEETHEQNMKNKKRKRFTKKGTGIRTDY